MANSRAELCLLLCLFTSVSVLFFESEGVDVTGKIQNGYFSLLATMLKLITAAKEQIMDLAFTFTGTFTEVLLNLITFLVAMKETILPEELCIFFLHWLYHNSVQIILYGAIFYLVYNIHKESTLNRKLMKDLRIISNLFGHIGWQVDAHSLEMKAIENRLTKNAKERIPSILNKLQDIQDLKEKQQSINKKFSDEMKIWKPRVEEQINNLTILNQKLYGTPDTEIFRKIRTVGWNAGIKFEAVKEMLHNRIEEVRGLLDESSYLLDIKGHSRVLTDEKFCELMDVQWYKTNQCFKTTSNREFKDAQNLSQTNNPQKQTVEILDPSKKTQTITTDGHPDVEPAHIIDKNLLNQLSYS